MEQRFALGRGSLLVREEGPRAAFSCDLPDDGRGLYKAYLRGEGGRYLLGTLMPEGGRLQLRRTVTIAELTRRRFWPVTGGEAELAFAFGQSQPQGGRAGPPGWVREYESARYMGDKFLSNCASQLKTVFSRREEAGFALACPWDTKEPFPLPPLFCFGQVEPLGERLYVIYHFNSCGCPVFPNKGK